MIKIVKLKSENLKCSSHIKDKISYLQDIAIKKNYWIKAYYYKKNPKKIVFEKRDVLIVINLENNNTVTTLKNHPKYKESKLKREALSLYQVGNILKNPRVHTSVGTILNKIEKE